MSASSRVDKLLDAAVQKLRHADSAGVFVKLILDEQYEDAYVNTRWSISESVDANVVNTP